MWEVKTWTRDGLICNLLTDDNNDLPALAKEAAALLVAHIRAHPSVQTGAFSINCLFNRDRPVPMPTEGLPIKPGTLVCTRNLQTDTPEEEPPEQAAPQQSDAPSSATESLRDDFRRPRHEPEGTPLDLPPVGYVGYNPDRRPQEPR